MYLAVEIIRLVIGLRQFECFVKKELKKA